jgi:hypothetical protein
MEDRSQLVIGWVSWNAFLFEHQFGPQARLGGSSGYVASALKVENASRFSQPGARHVTASLLRMMMIMILIQAMHVDRMSRPSSLSNITMINASALMTRKISQHLSLDPHVPRSRQSASLVKKTDGSFDDLQIRLQLWRRPSTNLPVLSSLRPLHSPTLLSCLKREAKNGTLPEICIQLR